MENTYKKDFEVSSYNIDKNMNLSLVTTMGILQDIANDHCETLNADRWSLLASSNAYWVTTKVRLDINQMPKMKDNFTAETWCLKNSAVKFERDGRFYNNNQTFINISSEWVAIDATTHKIRPAKTIAFPFDMKCREDRAIEGRFSTLNYVIGATDKVYTRTIYSTDIDVNNHVNNCFYSRFVLDCFSNDYLANHHLKTYEIHFVHEAKEGDILDFYKLDIDGGTYIEARNGEQTVIKVFITFK